MFRHVCRIIGGHRVETDGSALPQRAVKDVAQNRRTRRARRYAGSARRSDVSLVSQPSCPNGLQDAGDQNHAHGRSMVSEVLCGGAMMRTPARSCSRVPQSARGFWFVGQCHPTGSLGCEPSITRFVLSGECRARAASHWRSGGCHRGTRSGFIAVYFKVRQLLLLDAITGYGGREADAHARAGLHLQEYDQQSDS